ncbi:Uncharacterised protein [uncultured archaeon]|nr:Uncharacterised protein [uncultured archaeon]
MKERIKLFAPKITKRKRLEREAILISINEDIYVKEWMDGLLDGKNETYDTKRIKDAYKGMPVFFHYYGEGIRWRGKIIDPNDGFPVIGNVDETERIITIEEMRTIGIIKRNPPQKTQYLNTRRLQILNKLTK